MPIIDDADRETQVETDAYPVWAMTCDRNPVEFGSIGASAASNLARRALAE